MFPLWLLPLGYFALKRNKIQKYTKPVNSNTGLIFNCCKIEILNKRIAYNYIDSLIKEYKRVKAIYTNLDNVSIIEVFEFILNKLNKNCFLKMKKQNLSQKEKMIILLLFILVYNRFIWFVQNQNNFEQKFQNKDHQILSYLLNLSEEDEIDLNIINDQFNRNYSYP